MKTLKTNTKGFSLVELMVVVAIIGILATMAIPSVQKYMAKARQAEAKTTLSSIFTAEKAFYAEYNTYSATFSFIGFTPEGNFRYNTGFTAGVTNEASYGYSASSAAGAADTIKGKCVIVGTAGAQACTYTAEADTVPTAAVTNTAFIAGAAGNIYPKSGAVDTWTISDTKQLINSVDGIK